MNRISYINYDHLQLGIIFGCFGRTSKFLHLIILPSSPHEHHSLSRHIGSCQPFPRLHVPEIGSNKHTSSQPKCWRKKTGESQLKLLEILQTTVFHTKLLQTIEQYFQYLDMFGSIMQFGIGTKNVPGMLEAPKFCKKLRFLNSTIYHTNWSSHPFSQSAWRCVAH